jgi:hypothetical protein
VRIRPIEPYKTTYREQEHSWDFHCIAEGWDGKLYQLTGRYVANWEFAHALLGAFHANRFINSDKFFSSFQILDIDPKTLLNNV